MADHLILALAVLTWLRGFHVLLRISARHPAPRHQNHYAADVSDVGDSPQRVVHHSFLKGTETFKALLMCTGRTFSAFVVSNLTIYVSN